MEDNTEAKRTKYSENMEEGNIIQMRDTKSGSLTVESVILRLVMFFSSDENRNLENITKTLIPELLRESSYFKEGQLADLTSLKYLDMFQLRYIKIDHITSNEFLLGYIACFGKLTKLTLFINESDNFTGKFIKLNIKTLKIVADHRTNWNDAIEQIIHSCPIVNKISIHQGNLSLMSCIRLHNKHINSICLKDIRMQRQFKGALMNAIGNNPNLKKLKLITTDLYIQNITFHQIVQEFLGIFVSPNNSIEYLTFTISQTDKQNLSNLLNLSELKELKLYYTAQFSATNITNILKVLRHTPQIKVTFIEYYFIPPMITLSPDECLIMLRTRSIKYRILIETYCKEATIKMCENYDRLLTQNIFTN